MRDLSTPGASQYLVKTANGWEWQDPPLTEDEMDALFDCEAIDMVTMDADLAAEYTSVSAQPYQAR